MVEDESSAIFNDEFDHTKEVEKGEKWLEQKRMELEMEKEFDHTKEEGQEEKWSEQMRIEIEMNEEFKLK